MSKGVIMVKAAGNSGADGPFRADVATAVGAIAVASVDAHSRKVEMSQFSSYGPVRGKGRRESIEGQGTSSTVCVSRQHPAVTATK